MKALELYDWLADRLHEESSFSIDVSLDGYHMPFGEPRRKHIERRVWISPASGIEGRWHMAETWDELKGLVEAHLFEIDYDNLMRRHFDGKHNESTD